MKIHNFLPLFSECLARWEKRPTLAQFTAAYYEPTSRLLGILFDDDAGDFYSCLEDLNWDLYRAETLGLDPFKEEQRALNHLQDIERLFGFQLQGDIVLFSSFSGMDGYARFDRGTHRVFLGVDESHGRGAYLDVLETHELTHVARESRPGVWEGFGLSPKMTHDEFTENQPVIEHLMGEGFSCAISEILVPEQKPWAYAYQTEDSLALVYEHGPAVDREIKAELSLGLDGDYGRLYNSKRYGRGMPGFTHYVWAWQWAKAVLKDLADNDPRKLVGQCSKNFLEHAMEFELKST